MTAVLLIGYNHKCCITECDCVLWSSFVATLLFGDKSTHLRGHHLFHQQKYLAAYATDQNSDRRTGADASYQSIEDLCTCRLFRKTDSEEPKNKLEFTFFKRTLIWVSVFRTGYKVQFSLLLSRKIVQVVIKYLNVQILKKK